MQHLFDRVYLGIDTFRESKEVFYLASEEHAGNYEEAALNDPSILGLTTEEDDFFREGFFDLIESQKDPEFKFVIYTSSPTYLKLLARWIRAVFVKASPKQIANLLILECISLRSKGVTLDISTLSEYIEQLSQMEICDRTKAIVDSKVDSLSLEYKLLSYIAVGSRSTIATAIRIFSHRSMVRQINEARRNIKFLYFSKFAQEKYGYVAELSVDNLDLLSNIPKLNILNEPELEGRIHTLTSEEQDMLVTDLKLYTEEVPHIGINQGRADAINLKIINILNPVTDDEITDMYIGMLRSSNEHTDYLNALDSNKVKSYLIYWLLELSQEDCKGYEI